MVFKSNFKDSCARKWTWFLTTLLTFIFGIAQSAALSNEVYAIMRLFQGIFTQLGYSIFYVYVTEVMEPTVSLLQSHEY